MTEKRKRDVLRKDLSNYSGASNLSFNERIKALQAQGERIYHFGFGQSPFPVPECLVQGLKNNAHRHEYLSVNGLPELRDLILDFHKEYDGLQHFRREHIVMGAGSKEILYLAMMVFGYDVLIPSPAWTTYFPQSQLTGRTVHIIPSVFQEKYLLTPARLKEVVTNKCPANTPKLLIFNCPNNPSGQIYTAQELQDIVEVCREHHIVVLSDEIYARLAFKADHLSIAKFYPEGTILTTGFSKWASAGGWRAGYGLFPEELKDVFEAVSSAGSHTYTCCSSPIQHALVEGLQAKAELAEYMFHTSKILGAVSEQVHKKLTGVGVKAHPSQGGYYFMPDFEPFRERFAQRGITNGKEMSEAILSQAKVALMACDPYFLGTKGELTARFCFVNFDGGPALEESKRRGKDGVLDEAFIQTYCKPTMDGVDALIKWLTD